MTSKLTITDERLAELVAFKPLPSTDITSATRDEWMAMAAELQERRKADSEPDRNPVLAYADSYRDMAKQGVESVPIWSVITDLERNIAPLYRHAQQPTVVGDGRAEFETWMLKRWGRERRDDDFAMGKFIYGEDYADSYTRCVWKAWSASRAAMLAAAPQEVNHG